MTISAISTEIGLTHLGGAGANTSVRRGDQRAVGDSSRSDASDRLPVGVPVLGNADSSNDPGVSEPPRVPPVVNGLGLGLKFSTDAETGAPIISVVDLASGEVVRQIPSEEVLDFLRQFEDAKGALISVKL